MIKHLEVGAAVVAALVSVVAVYFSYEGLEAAREANRATGSSIAIAEKSRADAERHDRLSLKPILQLTHHLLGGKKDDFHYSVRNHGLGPAIVAEVVFVYRDQRSDGSIESLRRLTPAALGLSTRSLVTGQVLEAAKDYRLFESATPDVSCAVQHARRQFFRELKVQLKFKSLYDEVDNATLRYSPPEAVC